MLKKGSPWNTIVTLKIQNKSKAGVQNNRCRNDLAPAKRSSKGQSMEHGCDVEKLNIQVVARQFFVQRSREVKAIFKSKAVEKHQILIKHIEKSSLGGTPQEAKKIELAAKMAQDASKRGFGEALEASWGRLGRPKKGPRETKIEVGGVFFEVEKALA